MNIAFVRRGREVIPVVCIPAQCEQGYEVLRPVKNLPAQQAPAKQTTVAPGNRALARMSFMRPVAALVCGNALQLSREERIERDMYGHRWDKSSNWKAWRGTRYKPR